MRFVDKDLLSVQEARILMENAGEARKVLAGFEQERLDRIVVHMAQAAAKHARELAVMSCEETEYGNWQDKYRKNRYICEYLPEKLKTMRFVGIISEDREEKMMKVGVPLGIIAALTPSANPVSTAIYQALIAVKSGNAIVFAPHERAAKTTGRALDILMEAAAEAGRALLLRHRDASGNGSAHRPSGRIAGDRHRRSGDDRGREGRGKTVHLWRNRRFPRVYREDGGHTEGGEGHRGQPEF